MSVKLFRNSWLEQMTFMPMKIFLPFWTVALILSIRSAAPLPVLAFFGDAIIGLLVWTVVEYLAHRFLFHLDLQSSFGKQLIFVIHGNHHSFPHDALRNMMPLSVTVPIALLLWFISGVLDGRSGHAIFVGFLTGYILYDFIHYACHQYPMKKWPLSMLRRHHLVHHFHSSDANFGVSIPFWDKVFGTRPRKQR